jgi:Tol biopolymer transport system component
MRIISKLGIAIASAALAATGYASPALAFACPVSVNAGSTWTAIPEGRLLVDNGRDLDSLIGSEKHTLVTGEAFQRKYGSFSRDGKRIVYSDLGQRGYGAQIWVMNADGSGRKQVTALDSEAFAPKFSPDGRSIAFQTAVGGPAAIWLVNADGTHAHQVSKPGSYYGAGVSWNPSGTAFVTTRAQYDEQSGEPYNWAVVTVRADGTKETALTPAAGDKNSPAWSPDGQEIIFSYISADGMRDSAQYDLWAMKSDGAALHQLTHTPGIGEQATVISPDNKAIAYAAWATDQSAPQVMKATVDGSLTKSLNATGYPSDWK